MRLIDADAYADELKRREKLCFYQIDNADVNATVSEVEYWSGVIGTFNEAMCVLADAQTVATNILVTCAECKYWNPMNRFHQDYHPGRGECELNCWVRDSDWFCADGESKEDDNAEP